MTELDADIALSNPNVFLADENELVDVRPRNQQGSRAVRVTEEEDDQDHQQQEHLQQPHETDHNNVQLKSGAQDTAQTVPNRFDSHSISQENTFSLQDLQELEELERFRVLSETYELTTQQVKVYDAFVDFLAQFDPTIMLNILEDVLHDAQQRTSIHANYFGTELEDSSPLPRASNQRSERDLVEPNCFDGPLEPAHRQHERQPRDREGPRGEERARGGGGGRKGSDPADDEEAQERTM